MKSWFFEKINKMGKLSPKSTKKNERLKPKIIKSETKKEILQ